MIALKVSCFHYSKVDGLTTDTIKFEQALLITRNKEQLKKEAQELNTELTSDGKPTDLYLVDPTYVTVQVVDQRLYYIINDVKSGILSGTSSGFISPIKFRFAAIN